MKNYLLNNIIININKYKLTMTSKYEIISIINNNQLNDYSFDKLSFNKDINPSDTEIKKYINKFGYVI